jgi:phosphatidate cytidylyltransferase
VIINILIKLKDLIELKEFRLRIISSIILLTVFYLFFKIGNPLFVILLSCIFPMIFIEMVKMSFDKVSISQFFNIFFLQSIFFIYLISKLNNFNFGFIIDYDFLILSSFLINLYYYKTYHDFITFSFSNLIIISFFSLIEILLMSNGLNLFLYLVLLISSMDVFAYLGGKLLGNIKIIPKISNGKTVEGTLIGLISTVAISFMIKDLINLDTLSSLLLGFVIGILSFFGDMFESFVKRKTGIKDSGKLIPGHGGLMDRFDGYILVLPFFYILSYFILLS